MKRLSIKPRPDWVNTANRYGFNFASMYGQPYWDETHCYEFSLAQIENNIEAASAELHQMCLEVVDRAVEDEQWLLALKIPEPHWDLLKDSWRRRDVSLYGRFDLRYDGHSPAKLYEYNADTPTSLYESAFFQWIWLEEASSLGLIPAQADQYNSIQEKLISLLSTFAPLEPMYFSCVRDSVEDRGTVAYLEDCAKQAGLLTKFIYLDDVGVDSQGLFCGRAGDPIRHLFKLYPWEWALQDQFAEHLRHSDTHFYEPPWKLILSNKGILALLWKFFNGHPNLLPCYFEDDPASANLRGSFAKKPFFSREGANIELVAGGQIIERAEGPYGGEGAILQALAEPTVFDSNHVVIGSWIIGNEPCGMGIREDSSRITRDLSRFVPHFIC